MTTALMAEVPASSLVDTGKANRLAGMSFNSKLLLQDARNSCSRCGHLQRHFKRRTRQRDGFDAVAFVHPTALSGRFFRLSKGEEASFVPAKKLMSSFSSTFASVTRRGC